MRSLYASFTVYGAKLVVTHRFGYSVCYKIFDSISYSDVTVYSNHWVMLRNVRLPIHLSQNFVIQQKSPICWVPAIISFFLHTNILQYGKNWSQFDVFFSLWPRYISLFFWPVTHTRIHVSCLLCSTFQSQRENAGMGVPLDNRRNSPALGFSRWTINNLCSCSPTMAKCQVYNAHQFCLVAWGP